MYKNYIFLLLLSIILFSCEEAIEKRTDDDLGYDFYPISLGSEWIYSSDSILYNKQTSSIDTFYGFIKESVVDTFTNEQEEKVFVIERYFKRNWDDLWEISDVWSTTVSDTQVKETEENLTFVKLVFPPDLGQSWEGNAFIDMNTEVVVGGETLVPYKYWDYRVSEIGATLNFGSQTYNDVLTVTQATDSSEIELRYALEKYAKNIGMVYQELKILENQDPNTQGLTWEEKAEKGYILKMRLLEYK